MAMGGVGVRQYQKPVGGSLVPDFPPKLRRLSSIPPLCDQPAAFSAGG